MPRKSKSTGEGLGLSGERSPEHSLRSILSQPLTSENINTYHDDALHAVIALVDKAIAEYVHKNPADQLLTTRELEDILFGEEEIPQLLQTISDKKITADVVETYVTKHIPSVLIPPDTNKRIEKGTLNPYEKRKKRDHVKAVLYILAENGLDLDRDTKSIEGIVLPNMIRRKSYVGIEIPSLHRLVLVCDEEKNISFVFDTNALHGMTISECLDKTKSELKAFIDEHPESGKSVFGFKTTWANDIERAVFGDILDPKRDVYEKGLHVSRNELDPWKNFYPHPNGKHYGSDYRIAKRLGVHEATVQKRTQYLESIEVYDRYTTPVSAYAFEDVEKAFEEVTELPKVGEDGIVLIDGYEYATIPTIASGYENISAETIHIRVAKEKLRPKRIRNTNNGPEDGYRISAVKRLIEKLAETPVTIERFYTHTDGKHYGHIPAIMEEFGMTEIVARTFLKKHKDEIRKMSIRPLKKASVPGYCIEDIRKVIEHIPQRFERGEDGYYPAPDGKHYGSISTIAETVQRHHTSVDVYIRKRKKEGSPVSYVEVEGYGDGPDTVKAYCLEEIKPFYDALDRKVANRKST